MKCMVVDDDDDGKNEVRVWEFTGEVDWVEFSCMLAEW